MGKTQFEKDPALRRRFSHEELLSIVRYEPETGRFYWVSNPHQSKYNGLVAGGSYDKGKYGHIKIFGYSYSIHRLAWFYVTGK